MITVRNLRDGVNNRLPSFMEIGWITIRIKTQRGKDAIDRVSRRSRLWNIWNSVGVCVGFLMLVFMAITFVFAAWFTVNASPDPTPAHETRNVVAIPGVNDLMPLALTPYILFAIIVAATVHELGHAIAARVADIEVEEMGAIFLGPIPFGAYVKPDFEDIKDASTVSKLRIYCAGVMNNTALFVLTTPILLSSVTASPLEIGDAYAMALFSSGADTALIMELGMVTNTVFWLWFMNLNLALVNMLPIVFLDGGHALNAVIEPVVEKLGFDGEVEIKITSDNLATIATSVVMISAVLVALFGPHLL